MSLGRKKESTPPPPPPVEAPAPALNRAIYTNAQGDVTTTFVDGQSQYTSTRLSPGNQRLRNLGQQQVERLANAFAQPLPNLDQEHNALSNRLFDQIAQALNDGLDRVRGQVASSNAQRFGGSLNSTFGTQLLRDVEADRGRQLQSARLDADLQAEDTVNARFQQQENARLTRLNVFSSLLGGLSGQSQLYGQLGAETLDSSRRQRDARLAQIENLQAQYSQPARQTQQSTRRSALSSTLLNTLTFGLFG